MLPAVLRILVLITLMFGTVFVAAGRLDLPFVWALLGLYAVFMAASFFTTEPDLWRERLKPPSPGEDCLLRRLMFPFVIAHWVIAGLDVGRFHWSAVPPGLQITGLAAFAVGLGLVFWATRVNRFFSSVVRIQSERGHQVVTGGPYQYVRHPGYVASLLCAVGGGLALGSWWAMLPLAGFLVLVVIRTSFEDRFLQQSLQGYTDYTKDVRFRLVPGVW